MAVSITMNRKTYEQIAAGRHALNLPGSKPVTPNFRPGSESLTRGFTLLEILIAIFIFAVIATTIFGSYNLIFSSTGALDSGIAIYESARNCLSRMTVDLQSVYVAFPSAYTPEVGTSPDLYRFAGDTVTIGAAGFPRLRFTSLAHVAFDKSRSEGIAEIVYYVRPGEDGTFSLRRADALYPYEPFREKGTDPILCENLKSLKFTYYDAQGVDTDRWDSDSDDVQYATPRAVGIALEIGDESFSQQFTTLVGLPSYRQESE